MQHLFSAAETAHAAQRNREAIGYLLDILRIHDAHCPKAYYKLAVIYWSASNDAFSVRYCSLAARICRLHIDFERTNGTYEELMKKRGYSFEYWYYIFIGLIADFSSRLEAASTSYKLALELVNSKNIPDTGYEALLNLGIVEMNNNDLEEAIKLFYKAYDVETSPYYRSTCLNNIGQIHERKQEYTLALECYNKAIGIYKSDTLLYKNLVFTQCAMNDFPAALKQVNEICELLSVDEITSSEQAVKDLYTDFYSLKGYILEKMHKHDDAEQVYTIALSFNPYKYYLYASLADLQLRRDFHDEEAGIIKYVSILTKGMEMVRDPSGLEVLVSRRYLGYQILGETEKEDKDASLVEGMSKGMLYRID